jgi:hypothetical protein
MEPLVMDTYGWGLVRTGKVSEGMLILQDVVQRRPFAEARYHLAVAYVDRGFHERAVKELTAALAHVDEIEKRGDSFDPQMKKRIEELLVKANAGVAKEGTASKP